MGGGVSHYHQLASLVVNISDLSIRMRQTELIQSQILTYSDRYSSPSKLYLEDPPFPREKIKF